MVERGHGWTLDSTLDVIHLGGADLSQVNLFEDSYLLISRAMSLHLTCSRNLKSSLTTHVSLKTILEVHSFGGFKCYNAV